MIEINKIYIVVDEIRNIIRYKKILLIGGFQTVDKLNVNSLFF